MAGYIRQPRCTVNGLYPIECAVHISQHQSANTFSASLSLSDPANPGPAYWANTAPIQVTIMASNDVNSSGSTQMFIGNVDKVEIDWDKYIVHISGRDLTANLIDSKTNEKWLNKQPQDIITDLAGRGGLSVQFGGTAADRAGLKYKDDYNRISELDSYWNVIVKLAKEMGCIAYVTGTVLNVQPWDFTSGSFNITYTPPSTSGYATSTVMKLSTGRDLQLAKDVKVNHKSWQHKEGQAIESEFEASGSGGGTLEHDLKGANLTKQQQDSICEGRCNEIISHERTLTCTTYGDVSVQPGISISLSGTGTAFDQSYVLSDVEHHWSQHAGYVMTLRVRNKSEGRGVSKTK